VVEGLDVGMATRPQRKELNACHFNPDPQVQTLFPDVLKRVGKRGKRLIKAAVM